MIDVAQDAEGLRRAAVEKMQETLDESQHNRDGTSEKRLEEGSPRVHFSPTFRLRMTESRRTLSPGYYDWLRYVAEAVDRQLQAGVAFADVHVDADELLAFNVLGEACAEFVKKHPPCRTCSTPLLNESDEICGMCRAGATAGTN